MHLVRVEALSKQAYIFASNKLREAVGASHLIELSTTDWVRDAVARVLVNTPGVSVTVVISVSGLAELLVEAGTLKVEQAACTALVADVTTRALRPAEPMEDEDGGCGLRLLGAWIEVAGWPTADDLRRVRAAVAARRERVVSPLARFPRMPVVAACATSDGPAAHVLDDGSGDGGRPLSVISTAKRAANWRGRREIRTKLERRLAGELAVDVDELLVAAGDLERVLLGEVGWFGVVHADGNRIGELFAASSGSTTEISKALDECTGAALAEATRALQMVCDGAAPARADRRLPLVPLIASGDDLTVLVDGRYALSFAAAYLRAFSEISAADEVLCAAAEAAGRPGLTASAGVAIVKPHFPFSVAYELCEQACRSAKQLAAAAGVPALDWHVHYDSTGRSLGEARAALIRGQLHYLRRPYAVLTEGAPLPERAAGRDWAQLRQVVGTVAVLPHPDPGVALPSSQLHRLRHELVHGGPDRAARLYRTLNARPELTGLLGELGENLFDDVPDLLDQGATIRSTRLLDFLDRQFIDPTIEGVGA